MISQQIFMITRFLTIVGDGKSRVFVGYVRGEEEIKLKRLKLECIKSANQASRQAEAYICV
jgi:hypothetical protein